MENKRPEVQKTKDGRLIMKAGVKYRKPAKVAKVRTLFPRLAAQAPAAYDIDANIPGITNPMYLNDVYDDCVMVARAHQTRRLVYKPGQPILPISDSDVEVEYRKENMAEDGGVFKDDGLDLDDSMTRWQGGWTANGHRYTISEHHPIEMDVQSIELAISSLVGVTAVFHLPWAYKDYGNFGPGHDWTDASLGGSGDFYHAVLLVAYDANNVTAITWATRQVISWAFLENQVQYGYAVKP